MKRILLSTLATTFLLSPGIASLAAASPASDDSGGNGSERSTSSSQRLLTSDKLGRDPDTLTRRQAAALESKSRQILARAGSQQSGRPNGSVRIPIDFHGITDRQGHGFVSKARIRAQIHVLNRAYGGRTSPHAADTPFRFYLKSVDRVVSNRWYNANAFKRRGFHRLQEMKRILHVGDTTHLNVYTVGPKFQLLGYASFPAAATNHPRLDGIVIYHASIPGGNADFGPGSVYNQGDTATHEIGHWLNLFHTFQNGCSRLNDYVTDTPSQKADSNVFEEDATLNTCKPYTLESRDPVRNFMNYTDDPYMNRFTIGQRDRMDNAWYIREALS